MEKTVSVDIGERDMMLQLGPQHPSTHGVFNMLLRVEGDTIKGGESNIGYLHRGVEKLGESKPYFHFIPMTNDVDYVATISWEGLFVDAVEKMAGIQISDRTKYIRMTLLELQRIASHLLWVGDFCMNLGQHTLFLWAFRERELVLELMESVCGGRLNYEYFRFGGVAKDVPPTFARDCKVLCNTLESRFADYRGMIENEIFKARTIGIGTVTKKQALEYGFVGPALRGSGHKEDVRKFAPYLAYDKIDFDVPVETAGDCFARYDVRMRELDESIKIVRQCVQNMPEGPTDAMGVMRALLLKPKGEVYMRHEMPRGDAGIYIIGKGELMPYRLRLRSAGFQVLQNMDHLVNGVKFADIVAILGSIDPVFGDIDR